MDYTKKPFYLSETDLAWVDNTLAAMSTEEKLNQVFVDMLWNSPPKEVTAQQTRYQLGGYRYNNMTAEKLWEQNEAIQNASKIPALIAANAEAGGTAKVLAEELNAQGFEATVHKINYLKYVGPRGVNGKRALAEMSVAKFRSLYDAAILVCNVSGFSTTNERSLHWTIPMGVEIPWSMPTT